MNSGGRLRPQPPPPLIPNWQPPPLILNWLKDGNSGGKDGCYSQLPGNRAQYPLAAAAKPGYTEPFIRLERRRC